jgi:SAM-dependent methyltransferase
MTIPFQDHFSGHATDYARYRPTYPDGLFEAIANAAPARDVAWDVGCGNGQASLALANYFGHVEASDASADQIAAATQHPRVRYTVSPAEAPTLADRSVDAILVAQALHWFDHEKFYAAVRRVAKPNALIVAAMYDLAEITPEIDHAIHTFYRGDIGPYWPGDRRHIDTHYRSIPWPFTPVTLVVPPMTLNWSLDDLLFYLSTWSAVKRYMADGHSDPLPALRTQLAPLWGNTPMRTIRWTLHTLAGRVH